MARISYPDHFRKMKALNLYTTCIFELYDKFAQFNISRLLGIDNFN